jgi:hypothetical protein
MDRLEAALGDSLARWIRAVDGRARGVVVTIGVLTLALFVYAAMNLGINSDNVSLIAEHLEARQNYLEFTRSFPNIENVILVVIDGETPELARHASEVLQDALSKRKDLFEEVYIPGSGAFFEKNGLLYRDLDDLDEFALQISTVQPIADSRNRTRPRPRPKASRSRISACCSTGSGTRPSRPIRNFPSRSPGKRSCCGARRSRP